MSGWDAYITSLKDSSNAITRAAIVGKDASIWARTDGNQLFNATEAELKKFVSLFSDLSAVPTVGADLEGVHYIVPRTEENLIFGKREKTGFVAMQTKTAILIGIFEGEGAAGTEARAAVEKLASYLTDNNF